MEDRKKEDLSQNLEVNKPIEQQTIQEVQSQQIIHQTETSQYLHQPIIYDSPFQQNSDLNIQPIVNILVENSSENQQILLDDQNSIDIQDVQTQSPFLNISPENLNELNDIMEEEQYQMDEPDVQQEPQPNQQIENPFSEQANIQSIVNGLNNEIFLYEHNLEGLIQILMLDKESMFDDLSLNSQDLDESLEQIIKIKSKNLGNNLGSLLNIYEQKMYSGQLCNLERIMGILKSKHKEVHLKRISKNISNKQCSEGFQCTNQISEKQDNEQDVQSLDQVQNNLNKQNDYQKEQLDMLGNKVKMLEQKLLLARQQSENQKLQSNIEVQTVEQIEQNENNQLEKQEQFEQTAVELKEQNLKFEQETQVDMIDQPTETLQEDLDQQNEQYIPKLNNQYQEIPDLEQQNDEEQTNVNNNEEEFKVDIEQQQKQQVANEQLEDSKQKYIQSSKDLISTLEKKRDEQSRIIEQLRRQRDEQYHILQKLGREKGMLQQRLMHSQAMMLMGQPIPQQNDDIEQTNYQVEQKNNDEESQENNQIQIQNQQAQNNQNQEQEANLQQQYDQMPQQEDQESQQNHIEQSQQKKQAISIGDIANIISMKFLHLGLFQQYDPVEKCITFQLNEGYQVQVKSCDEIVYQKESLCHIVPQVIFQQNIFSFFTAFELFKLRGVNKEWREMIRTVWHKTFKREMYEQLMAADLCKEIEKEFKLVHLRNPFRQKLALLLKAIIELIAWPQLEKQMLDGTVGEREKKIIFCINKILGVENQEAQQVKHISEIPEDFFENNKIDLASTLKENMNKIFETEFHFTSKNNIQLIKQNFFSSYEFSIEQFSSNEDKNSLLLILFLKQVYVYALLKNYIFIVQNYIHLAKNKLDQISKDWPENKGFLEGAYKILLLRNVKIKDKKIVNKDQSDDEEETVLDDNNQSEAEQMLKSLFNIKNHQTGEPDFVIRKRGQETRVFLDLHTKLDIIMNSLLSLSSDVMNKVVSLGCCAVNNLENGQYEEDIKQDDDNIQNEEQIATNEMEIEQNKIEIDIQPLSPEEIKTKEPYIETINYNENIVNSQVQDEKEQNN